MQFLHQLTTISRDLVTHIAATVKISNPPYMTLTVENIGPGPRNLPALSICHYGEQNGDAMRDPEMCFEMEIEDGKVKEFYPYYYRNDYAGIEQFAQDEETGSINAHTVQTQREFAELWSRNLTEQGFLRGYKPTNI
jgi:hypothetical protein